MACWFQCFCLCTLCQCTHSFLCISAEHAWWMVLMLFLSRVSWQSKKAKIADIHADLSKCYLCGELLWVSGPGASSGGLFGAASGGPWYATHRHVYGRLEILALFCWTFFSKTVLWSKWFIESAWKVVLEIVRWFTFCLSVCRWQSLWCQCRRGWTDGVVQVWLQGWLFCWIRRSIKWHQSVWSRQMWQPFFATSAAVSCSPCRCTSSSPGSASSAFGAGAMPCCSHFVCARRAPPAHSWPWGSGGATFGASSGGSHRGMWFMWLTDAKSLRGGIETWSLYPM